MPATYDKLVTTTLGSDQSSVTLSSIPSNYTDMVLIMNFSMTGSGTTNISMRFNGDSRFKYSSTRLLGDGSSASSTRITNNDFIVPATNVARGSTATLIAHFNNYSNSTTYKTVLCRFGNATSVSGASVSLWQVTDGIGSIFISPEASGANLGSGSVFTLYGIKAA